MEPKVIKADSTYEIWYRLIPGVEQASVSAATASNCTTMISDLSSLAQPKYGFSYTWYDVAAVEAHERVHVTEWKSYLDPHFPAMKAAIESIEIPHACGMDSRQVTSTIQGMPQYVSASDTAKNNAIASWNGPYADPNPKVDAAERAVVSVLIQGIKAKGVTNGWPAACQ